MLPFCQMCLIAIKTYVPNLKVYYQLGRKIIVVSFYTERFNAFVHAQSTLDITDLDVR